MGWWSRCLNGWHPACSTLLLCLVGSLYPREVGREKSREFWRFVRGARCCLNRICKTWANTLIVRCGPTICFVGCAR